MDILKSCNFKKNDRVIVVFKSKTGKRFCCCNAKVLRESLLTKSIIVTDGYCKFIFCHYTRKAINIELDIKIYKWSSEREKKLRMISEKSKDSIKIT